MCRQLDRVKHKNPIELLEESPVIAAVKDDHGLETCLKSECTMVFILYGNICNISEITKKIKQTGKIPIVHVDLIYGLGKKEIIVDFIKKNTQAEGIISTNSLIVKHAQELGLYGVQRTFVIDSMALSNLKKQLMSFHPDFVEIMPGVISRVLREVRKETDIPLIAGGLLSEKKEMMDAFNAGADAISTTREELWYV